MDSIEQRRSLLQAQDMTGSVIHLLVARSGIDGKQLIHQLDDTDRGGIHLVELDRVDKTPSRMAPTCRMHHLRAAHAAAVGSISVGLQYSLELIEETRWAFAPAAHAKIEDRRAARRAVLP